METAAIREMTIFPLACSEMSSRMCLASAALTAMIMRSASFEARVLSVVTWNFFGIGRLRVETFLFVTIILLTREDLAVALATASPILPAPSTATITQATQRIEYFGLFLASPPQKTLEVIYSPRSTSGPRSKLSDASMPQLSSGSTYCP